MREAEKRLENGVEDGLGRVVGDYGYVNTWRGSSSALCPVGCTVWGLPDGPGGSGSDQTVHPVNLHPQNTRLMGTGTVSKCSVCIQLQIVHMIGKTSSYSLRCHE